MAIQLTSDNIDVRPSMHELVKEKLKRMQSRLIDVPEDLQNIRVVLNKDSGETEFLAKIELYLNGKFDKILVFNAFGYYVGNIRLIDGVLIYTDLDGKATPFKLQNVPQIPLKQT